jgi:mono/diheme cytochrome c family protein
MMRRGSGIVVSVLLVAIFAGAIWMASFLRRGLSAREQPTAIEAFAARTMRHWATPERLRALRNPVPLTAAVLAESRAHFADHCAICHGNDGRGQTEVGQHLYPRAPDMTLAGTQLLSDGELFGIIENGIRLTGMPAWGNGSPESSRGSWTLVHFIRHLPKITTEEVGEMEKLNPKSPEEYEEAEREEQFLEGTNATTTEPRPTPENHHH